MLNAHMDTVGVAGMTDPFDPRLEDGRLYGRGAYDMKGSLAACMLATAEAERRGLRGDVILTAVSDEEFASVGTEAVAADVIRADAAIVTEPTEMQVVVAHRGFVALEVETIGRAAHGSRPASRHRRDREDGPRPRRHRGARSSAPCAIRRTRTSGVAASTRRSIEGGQEYSSYPGALRAPGRASDDPGRDGRSSRSGELREILARAAAGDPDFSAELRARVRRASRSRSPRTPRSCTTVRGCAAPSSAAEPEVVGVSFWADSALLAAAGIPTVLFGPRGEGAHAEVEWVDVASLERCVEIYVAVAPDLCS